MSSQGGGKEEFSFTCLTLAGGLTSYPQGQPRPSDIIYLNFLTRNEPQKELTPPYRSSAVDVSTCQALTLLFPQAPIPPGLLSALHSLPPPCHCYTSICCFDAINPYSHPSLVPAPPTGPKTKLPVTNVILTAGLWLLHYPPFQPDWKHLLLSITPSFENILLTSRGTSLLSVLHAF